MVSLAVISRATLSDKDSWSHKQSYQELPCQTRIHGLISSHIKSYPVRQGFVVSLAVISRATLSDKDSWSH
ncbi:hypothetical protein DPMN_035522 [Dreissena polymorpha]|uniref:Uncharacterized protein n=1 Tax=Dreissena polymorpha TaxID=45954 RepID=A0A9D4MB46_DREPO|nr:hypothetical protein DPMN_035521 [Dreissena polymorpha]KAH3872307.1 hypothetical protein DPMN_035522 [Dreissena polymorpha]